MDIALRIFMVLFILIPLFILWLNNYKRIYNKKCYYMEDKEGFIRYIKTDEYVYLYPDGFVSTESLRPEENHSGYKLKIDNNTGYLYEAGRV